VRPNIGVEVTREPIGVVGLITPWNFRSRFHRGRCTGAGVRQLCGDQAGRSVPGCAWAIADIISRSGIPAGVFNLVMGRGSVVGEGIIQHRDVNAISFTGSVGVGSRIAGSGTEARKCSSKWAARIRRSCSMTQISKRLLSSACSPRFSRPASAALRRAVDRD
jgi:aldehyde dehydrogenase (NAD+)